MNRVGLITILLWSVSFQGPAWGQDHKTVWPGGSGDWADNSRWQSGVPTGLVRALLRGHSDVTLREGRRAVGGLSVGAGRGEAVTLTVDGGELVIRRNLLVIGEEDGGSGTVNLNTGALQCVGDTSVAAANCEPGRRCQGTLRIRGGNFVTRILTLGWGPGSEARIEIEGSRSNGIFVMDYVTMGAYLDRPPSRSAVSFALDEQGVTPVTIQNPRGGLSIVRSPAKNVCRLEITLGAVPPREDVTLFAAAARTKGFFDGLPEGAEVHAALGDRDFFWTLTYAGGRSGCDVVLTQVRGHLPGEKAAPVKTWTGRPDLLWTGMPLRERLPRDVAPAFEGAEGFGAIAQGGRGGKEIAVRNLNDAGAGSLRDAIEQKGARTIVFQVGGVIQLQSPLVIREPFVSILGQSAPGPGVSLRGHGMVVRTHDVILRYLRVRPGEESRGDDALEFYDAERCTADHCSLEWGDDETCSITGLSDAITIQNCIIAEGLNHEGHSMASICGGERTTWHHNLIAHCRTRNPRFADVATCDFRNNVVFNWGDTAAYGEFERVNLVNNWFKPGPSTTQQPPRFHIGETVVTPGTLFAKGNVMESRDEVTKDNWIGIGFPREVEAANPFEAPPVTTGTAAEACQTVIAGAGATLPERDEIDARIVESVRTGSGRIIDRVRPEESGR